MLFPEVVDGQISGMPWRSCHSMKTLCECLVEVILSWPTDSGIKGAGV